MENKNIKIEWENILQMGNTSPYVFRTRLERAINHSDLYAKQTNNTILKELCEMIKNKLKYISDQSNQTSDGMLNSYSILKNDINKLLQSFSN